MDKTNYFTVEVYRAQARACVQYLGKGSRVVIDAELDWREWTDQQGNKREAVTFTARQVLFEGAAPDRPSRAKAALRTTRLRPLSRALPPAPRHLPARARRAPTTCRSDLRARR